VSLCGEMASSPGLVATLLGCGLTVLSCAPAQIGAVKLAISDFGGKPRDRLQTKRARKNGSDDGE